MAAVRAMEAEEAGGEVTAAEEVADGGEDVGTDRAEGGTVDVNFKRLMQNWNLILRVNQPIFSLPDRKAGR
jgi:hypothetical protein